MPHRTVLIGVGLALLSAAVDPAVGAAMPFPMPPPTPLRVEAAGADLVLIGTLNNPGVGENPNAPDSETTTFLVKIVLRDHPARAGRTALTIPRNLPVPAGQENRFLVFVDAGGPNLDFYRGVPLKGDAMTAYLREAMTLDRRPAEERLRFFFRHVDSSDPAVADDAYYELSGGGDEADVPALLRLAPGLDRSKLRRLVRDRSTRPDCAALYAVLLGAAGDRGDVAVLTDLLDRSSDPARPSRITLSGALAGLILLDRPLGWSRLTALLQDGRREMLDRYTGLSVVRFFAQYCPDRIHRDILAEAIDPLLDQPDMADIVVEQYRLWGRWEKTGRIVSLYGRGGFNLPGIKRPVLRFALSCPEQTPGRVKAAALVRALRELAPEWVADAEELLRLEEQSRREEADRKKTVPQP